MGLEELTLHYYSKVFSIILIFFLFLTALYIYKTINKNIIFNQNPINIKKGEKLEKIFSQNINNYSFLEIEIAKFYVKIINKINKSFVHYGDFEIQNNTSLITFINTITKPSNILLKITIVEGWSKKQLERELSKYFSIYESIPYENIIADTYFFQKNIDFNTFVKKLYDSKKNYFDNIKNNKLLNNFTENELMIIGSLIEKEGLDRLDKKQISSVIFNRLNNSMKLQIDATVIYSITNGNYDLQRKLLLSDLKVNHPYNTYIFKGLPPKPISYVGRKTLDIVFENYETEFLFYFFNKSLNKHIFSKSYKEHKEKLNDYRNK